MATSRCTCSGDVARCGTCLAIERITHDLLHDRDTLKDVQGQFETEQYDELADRAADAVMTGDWSQHNAYLDRLVRDAVAKRAQEQFEDMYDRAIGLVKLGVAA